MPSTHSLFFWHYHSCSLPHSYSWPIGLTELPAPQATRLAYDPGQANENPTGVFLKSLEKRGSLSAKIVKLI